MTLRITIMRRNKRRYELARGLDDWVEQPEEPSLRQPVPWLETEDGEVSPAAYSRKELQPYKRFPVIHDEMINTTRPVSVA
jgi:hypothetical protein